MALPLEGIKVIELCHWALGPMCARILGELGADVIKVEDPRGGDIVRGVLPPELWPGPINPWWEQLNGSKRAIAVDLSQEAGKEVIYKLVKTTDVLVTNFRASVIDKLGLDYETVARINPQVVYAQATGFGPKGPDRDRRAFDETAFWIRSGISLPSSLNSYRP